jgi:hypothetical protein
MDLGILNSHLGLTSGAAPSQGDMNGDGAVNRADAAALARQFGKSALQPSPAAPSAVVAAAQSLSAAGIATDNSPSRVRRLAARREFRDAGANALLHDAALSDADWSDSRTLRGARSAGRFHRHMTR